jgi:hypothetical protein
MHLHTNIKTCQQDMMHNLTLIGMPFSGYLYQILNIYMCVCVCVCASMYILLKDIHIDVPVILHDA